MTGVAHNASYANLAWKRMKKEGKDWKYISQKKTCNDHIPVIIKNGKNK